MARMGGWRVGGNLVDPEVPLEERKQLAELLSTTLIQLQDELRTLSGGEVAVQVDADLVLHGDAVPDGLPSAQIHRDLVGADLHIPKAHATSHEQAQSDALSVGTPSRIGVANSAGVAANYCRRDHNHALLETGGQELTLGVIGDGQVLTRSGGTVVGAGAAAISPYVDHVFNIGAWDLAGGGSTPWTRTNVVDDTLVELLFGGTSIYTAPAADFFIVRAETGAAAAASATIDLVDLTGAGTLMATITIPPGSGLAIYAAPVVADVPAAQAAVAVWATVPIGYTLTVRSLCWGRYKT